MPPVLRGRDIVCVGSVGWRAHPWTEEHHLTARLARDNRVLYVEPPRAGGGRLSGPLGSGLGGTHDVAGVHVVTPPVLRGAPGRGLRIRLVRRAARRLRLADPLLWGFVPEADELADALAPSAIVYHCLHDAPDRELERRFAMRADLVLARAPGLAARLRRLGVEPRLAPAVADTAAFARALAAGPVDEALAALPRPRIVVTGVVSARMLDVELLAALAARRREWSIALVGPAAREPAALAPLRQAPNVHLLGERPYAAMPEVLRGADAGLVPLCRTPDTESLFPLRVFEYLAAGLPVVATPLPALEGVEGVALAGDAAGFADALDELLAHDDLEARRARSAVAATHSWDARLDELAGALRVRA